MQPAKCKAGSGSGSARRCPWRRKRSPPRHWRSVKVGLLPMRTLPILVSCYDGIMLKRMM